MMSLVEPIELRSLIDQVEDLNRRILAVLGEDEGCSEQTKVDSGHKKPEDAAHKRDEQKLAQQFNKLDANGNGQVSAEEMMEAMIKNGKLEMGSKTSDDFIKAMKNYINSDQWMGMPDVTEITEEVFVKFWSDFYAMLRKLDQNGDQLITVNEALKWFQQRASEKSLDRSETEYSHVSKFFTAADTDGDGQLTIVEFFIGMQLFRDTVVAFDKGEK